MNKSNYSAAIRPYKSYNSSKSLDFLYKESLTAQVQDIFNTLDEFYDSIHSEFNKNYIIIEIGTYFGGFTKILSDSALGRNSNGIYTFDIEDLILNKRQSMIEFDHIKLPEKKVSESLKENCENVYFNLGDVFSFATMSKIANLCKNNKLIIFCDGGNKPKEVNFFSQFLKVGDFIFAHDYSLDKDYFEQNINNKIWYWLETTNADIKDACDFYNLETFMEDKFNKCVWTCRRKVK